MINDGKIAGIEFFDPFKRFYEETKCNVTPILRHIYLKFGRLKFSCNFNINKYNMIQALRSVLIVISERNQKEVNKMGRKKIEVEADVKSFPATEKRLKKNWKKPILEDVSGKVMAQPYIRFT